MLSKISRTSIFFFGLELDLFLAISLFELKLDGCYSRRMWLSTKTQLCELEVVKSVARWAPALITEAFWT